MSKTANITVEYTDENGEIKQDVFTAEYDETKTEVFTEIEYISVADGGPVMRPKKPRRTF